MLQEIGRSKGHDISAHIQDYERKLDNAEGREELEQKVMDPLGVKHLGLTKLLANTKKDEILRRKLLVP